MTAAGDAGRGSIAANVAAWLTPPGVAAIAVLRLTGPLNASFAAAHLSRPPKPGRCVHADLHDGETTIDDVVAVRIDDARLDLNLHGGVWVVEAATRLVVRFGYAIVDWRELPPDVEDAVERQVLLDLPKARSREAIRLLTAQPAAWRTAMSRDELERALADTALERLLTTPTVAIVGAPNVGKSTLANALIGGSRNIIADVAGTTRDWTSHPADVGGLIVRLVDTAGLRETDDRIEAAAIANGRPVVGAADLVLLAIDGSSEVGEAAGLRAEFPALLVVLTKADRPRRCGSGGLAVSAITGEGMDTLRHAVRSRLGCDDVTSPVARCWTGDQREAIRRALTGEPAAKLAAPAVRVYNRRPPPGRRRPGRMMVLAFSIDLVKSWILDHGWWGGAFISFSLLFACGLGLPLPEDVPLIISGAVLCHDPHGGRVWEEWLIVGLLNWLGIMGGDTCLYWISRRLGRNITRLPLIGTHVTLDRIDKVGGWFQHYGVGVVGVGRLFAGVRGAMVITAGITRFNFAKFLVADGLAAIVSGGLFMALGYWVGAALNDATIHKFKHYFVLGAIVLAVVVVGYIVWKQRSHRKSATASTGPQAS